MIVANLSKKTLLELELSPSVINVKVTATSQLIIVVKFKITFVDGVSIEAPDSDSENLHITRILTKATILIMTKKVLMLNAIVFDPHLQITYLSSGVHSHNTKRRTIGEELLSSTHH